MIVFLTLTTAGSDSGPFNLYSDLDGYIIPFETDVFKSSLEAGYSTTAPDGTQTVKVVSTGACINSTYITLAIPDCDLAGYVEEITTTTTSTTTAAPVITTVTEINIWFDNSGSMNTTLTPLQTMQNTLLKDCIGPIYGYDPLVPGSDALYNTRVKVLSMFDTGWNYNERFVQCLATSINFNRTTDATVNQVLNLTFQDESDPYGNGTANPTTFNNAVIAAQYATDVATLRTNVAANPGIKGVAFQVNTGPGSYPSFRALTQATFVNTGIYTPNANISDLTQFTYELDVVAASTPEYYLTQVTNGLTTLGFTVNCSPTTTTTTTTYVCPDCVQGADVLIGTQLWTTCNLDVDTYRDLTPIPQATSDADWANKGASGIGAWRYYEDNTANGPRYGKLYNWFAVNNTVNGGLAPLGYHVPSNTEWTQLTDYLDAQLPTGNVGGKMKATGTIEGNDGCWLAPNEGATNSSGFRGQPGGLCDQNGTFLYISEVGQWWSSTDELTQFAWTRSLYRTNGDVFSGYTTQTAGFSVRLIQD